jgi:hypothetical protein
MGAMVYLLALVIGIIAGLRTMTAPAAMSWAAYLGYLNLGGGWLAFMGYRFTPWLFSVLPFVAVHVLLFASLDWTIALASTLLAVATTFPLCYFYDLNRRTIWASALIHWIMQGSIKLVMIPDGFSLPISLGWMAICVTVPYVVFVFRKQLDL